MESNITYLKLENLSFDCVRSALKNPNECVSPTEHPETVNIIKEIINDPRTFAFTMFEDNEEDSIITKTACAILNNGYGTIVIGVSSDEYKNIIGVVVEYIM